MGVTNREHGTRVDEVAEGIFRISTPVREIQGGFTFNQYLIKGDQPLLFHSGPRRMAALVREAVASIIPMETLRFIAFSHFESDESGAMGEHLQVARKAEPVSGRIGAMVNGDAFDKPLRGLADGETLVLGGHRVRWIDAPHLPHGWDCGYLMEEKTGTLLCGDLFTQGGADQPPLTSADILGPSEQFRKTIDYFSQARNVRQVMARLASARPKTLACMHGSAWQGDGSALLTALGEALDK